MLLLDDAAFSILLESWFSRFDGILVIVIVNAVGSRTITAIWHPFIVEFTAGLLSFGGSFNIIGEFRNLSLRCCYCLRTYWGGFWQHSSSPSFSHGSIMIRGRYCCSFKHAFRQQSSHHHFARGIFQPPSPSSLPTSPSLERRS